MYGKLEIQNRAKTGEKSLKIPQKHGKTIQNRAGELYVSVQIRAFDRYLHCSVQLS